VAGIHTLQAPDKINGVKGKKQVDFIMFTECGTVVTPCVVGNVCQRCLRSQGSFTTIFFEVACRLYRWQETDLVGCNKKSLSHL
jgi:hypothetical protein